MAGVEKILSQDPFEPPTRVTKRSPKPLFHVASKEEREDLMGGFLAFQAQYQIASEALRRGNLKGSRLVPRRLLSGRSSLCRATATEETTMAADTLDHEA